MCGSLSNKNFLQVIITTPINLILLVFSSNRSYMYVRSYVYVYILLIWVYNIVVYIQNTDEILLRLYRGCCSSWVHCWTCIEVYMAMFRNEIGKIGGGYTLEISYIEHFLILVYSWWLRSLLLWLFLFIYIMVYFCIVAGCWMCHSWRVLSEFRL